MAVSRTEQLLETLEGAASEAHAAEALYALLQATRVHTWLGGVRWVDQWFSN